ncbi:MAG: rhodanese-like domain-containing protein [Candidatus Riflebacteria bacterium]|nr:rhodanese-like domain-containing protein [Candidatus Riflebacteria bacterium]
MKIKIFLIAMFLIASFGVTLHSEEGCSSCSSAHSEVEKPAAKAAETCEGDVCSADEHAHKTEAPAASEEKPEPVATINTLGLKTLINSGVPVIVLDARSGKYDDGRRLPGALSLNSESKPEDIAKVIKDKEALVVTYCSNLKCPASHALYTHLKTLGYTNLIEYPEGIDGWVSAGNPVNSAK